MLVAGDNGSEVRETVVAVVGAAPNVVGAEAVVGAAGAVVAVVAALVPRRGVRVVTGRVVGTSVVPRSVTGTCVVIACVVIACVVGACVVGACVVTGFVVAEVPAGDAADGASTFAYCASYWTCTGALGVHEPRLVLLPDVPTTGSATAPHDDGK